MEGGGVEGEWRDGLLRRFTCPIGCAGKASVSY